VQIEPIFRRACWAHEKGQHDQALRLFDQVLDLDPAHALAYLNRGVVLQSLGRWQDSVMSLTQALAFDAHMALGWSNLGVALKQLGQLDAALQCFDRAIDSQADLASAHTNRGVVLRDLLRFEEAIASHKKAISLRPDQGSAWNNLGLALKEAGKMDEALDGFDQALVLDRTNALAWCNKGVTLQSMHRSLEALECYEQALTLRPDMADLDWNRSHALLSLGRMEEGWSLFEARWQAKGVGMTLRYPQSAQWKGENLFGKTVLVWHEQGLGDTLQFCRYVPLLKRLGAIVILEVPASLHKLLSCLPGVDQLITRGDSTPAFDWHCPMMSLPGRFAAQEDGFTWEGAYLKAHPADAIKWSERLGQPSGRRIGLVWSGGFRPDQPELHATNQRRNLPFESLAPLIELDYEFFSLQKGDHAEREYAQASPRLRQRVTDWTADLSDFAETAALIENVDLVISVDTSTAHLAAAMGKPVWLLNRRDSCWRWRLSDQATPWYPSLRLFNQSRPGDWGAVIEEVRVELDQPRASFMKAMS
jgi:tetratricopeptide (TPR) repeat protein/ADP-heptose:LPS heptosyltransferase